VDASASLLVKKVRCYHLDACSWYFWWNMLDKKGFLHAFSCNWLGIFALIVFFFLFQAKFVETLGGV
jgi:hypothetical protein